MIFAKLGGSFALAILFAAPAALAQHAGTYTGTNNEGDQVQVVVTQTGSAFEITGLSDSGTVYCKHAGTTYGYGVAIGGNLAPIVDGRAMIKSLQSIVYVKSTLHFTGDKVTGGMLFSVPILDLPKRAEACATMPQTFTATLGGTAAQVPAHGAYAWPLATK